MINVACNWKLTGELRVMYEAVCHVTKHNAHERQNRAVDHSHERPGQDHHNIPAVCEPELHSHERQKEQKSASVSGGCTWWFAGSKNVELQNKNRRKTTLNSKKPLYCHSRGLVESTQTTGGCAALPSSSPPTSRCTSHKVWHTHIHTHFWYVDIKNHLPIKAPSVITHTTLTFQLHYKAMETFRLLPPYLHELPQKHCDTQTTVHTGRDE